MTNELLGSANLVRLLSRSDYLVPEIAKNDKGLSWDGHICVYRMAANQHSVGNLLWRVPIYVKQAFEPSAGKPIGWHDIRLNDLRNYKTEHGTLYFKVYTDRAGEDEQIYYKGLLDGDVKRILAAARGKDTVSVPLDPFPTDIWEIDMLVLTFAQAMLDDTKRNEEKYWEDYARASSLLLPAPMRRQSVVENPHLYYAGTVGFHGREDEMKQLRAFLDDERRFCWWGVVGEGGVGKSRLAYELCKRLNDAGDWYTQRLDRNDLDELPELTRDEFNERFPYPTLLVADYAQQHAAALGAWMRKLAERDFGRREKLRILLLERADKGFSGETLWEKELLGGRKADELHRARYKELMELVVPPKADLRRIMLDFAAYLRKKEPTLPLLDKDEVDALLGRLARMPEVKERPLFAMLLADAALHHKLSPDWSWESLLKYQLDREHDLLLDRLGEGAAGNELLQDAVLMLRLVATVLGVSGDPSRETMDKLCNKEMERVGKAADKADVEEETLLRRLGLLDASLEWFCAFRPDLLGEYLVLDWLRGAQEKERSRFFSAILTDEDAVKTFFLRILRDFGELIQTSEGLADWLFPAAVWDDKSAAALVRLARILRTLFDGAHIEAAETDPTGGKTYVYANSEAARASLVRRMKSYVDALRENGVPAAQAFHDYADVLRQMGDYTAAEAYCFRAMQIEEKYAPDSPDLATTYNNLAEVYRAMGDFPKALEFHEKALNIRETVLGKEHPDTAASYINMGMWYYSAGDLLKALEYYQKALAIREKVLGVEHPSAAQIYNNLGAVYYAMGDLPKALEFYEKALAIRIKALGAKHPSTAQSYNNLGALYRAMGDYPHALAFIEKALAIWEKALGTKHPSIAESYRDLGAMYRDMGDLPKALEFYEKALAIRMKALGAKHPDTADSYNDLVTVYRDMGDLPKALECHKKALAIREMVLGRDHPNTIQSYQDISFLYLELDCLSMALEYEELALKLWNETLGAEHPHTKLAREWVSVLNPPTS